MATKIINTRLHQREQAVSVSLWVSLLCRHGIYLAKYIALTGTVILQRVLNVKSTSDIMQPSPYLMIDLGKIEKHKSFQSKTAQITLSAIKLFFPNKMIFYLLKKYGQRE